MRARLTAAAILAAAALTVTACGGSSGTATTTTSQAPLSSAASALSSARSAAAGAMSSAAAAASSAASSARSSVGAAASSAVSAARSAVSAATGGTGSTSGAAFDVCTILPYAQAAQLSGQPYTQGEPGSSPGVYTCAYDNDDATATGVNVEILSDPDGSTWSVVHVDGVTDIPGLGDKAMWDNDNTLYAVKGDYIVQVNGLDNDQAHSEALAKVVIAALP